MSRKNPFVMPILKWVGGKRQLLDSINPLIPECSTYYEPFIGGGAVLFGRQPNKAVINVSEFCRFYQILSSYQILLLCLQICIFSASLIS